MNNLYKQTIKIETNSPVNTYIQNMHEDDPGRMHFCVFEMFPFLKHLKTRIKGDVLKTDFLIIFN